MTKPPKNEAFVLGGEPIQPGEVAHLDLSVARLPTHTNLAIPVIVRHGRREGPRVWLSAAIHGDELNGIEIIHRVLGLLEDEAQDRGTIVAVPIVNVFGFVHQSRYLPDGRDLNRCFPGSARGSLASRVARLFMEEIVDKCTHGIDLHTGSNHRGNLPQIRANLDLDSTATFAESFAAPVTVHAKTRDGSLRDAVSRRKVPVLLYEAGEAQRFDETCIETGTRGVMRALHHLGLTGIELEPAPAGRVVRKSKWVRASRGGLLRLSVRLGDELRRGQTIGSIVDPFGGAQASVKSPTEGLVIGQTYNPVVYQGDALVHVGFA